MIAPKSEADRQSFAEVRDGLCGSAGPRAVAAAGVPGSRCGPAGASAGRKGGHRHALRRATCRAARQERNNTFAGFGIAVGVCALVFTLDPLYVLFPDDPQQAGDSLLFMVLMTVATLGLGVGALLIFARTRIEVTATHLIVLNPLLEIALPREGTRLADGRVMGFPRLRSADGEIVTAWGGENAAFDLEEYLPDVPAQAGTAAMLKRRRSPGRSTWLLISLGSLYIVTGVIAW